MSQDRRSIEHAGYRVVVEKHEGEWCASIANKRPDGVHRPFIAAFALDDVGALRELYRLVQEVLGAVTVAGRLAVKLRG